MTNQERAEKIFRLFIAESSYRDIVGEHRQICNEIISQLDEAVADAVREAGDTGSFHFTWDALDFIKQSSFREGFAAAQEKAAIKVEEAGMGSSVKELAKRIRRMEP